MKTNLLVAAGMTNKAAAVPTVLFCNTWQLRSGYSSTYTVIMGVGPMLEYVTEYC